jgi:hypothetical protein
MISTTRPSLLDQWRRRFAGRHHRSTKPRPLAALGYLAHSPVVNGLIEIDRLLLVTLYDEPSPQGTPALRLAGFSASRIPWGIRWGGPGQCRFLKDLLLQPVPQARGRRLDLEATKLLQLGLQLDRQLHGHARYPSLPKRRRLRLPCLWAGFQVTDATEVTGDGPELAAYSQRTGKSGDRLLRDIRREHGGLALYPLAWVSHHWQQAVTIFADLQRFPKWQVFSLRRLPENLVGYDGAAEFDLFHSPFQRSASQRPQSALARVAVG